MWCWFHLDQFNTCVIFLQSRLLIYQVVTIIVVFCTTKKTKNRQCVGGSGQASDISIKREPAGLVSRGGRTVSPFRHVDMQHYAKIITTTDCSLLHVFHLLCVRHSLPFLLLPSTKTFNTHLIPFCACMSILFFIFLILLACIFLFPFILPGSTMDFEKKKTFSWLCSMYSTPERHYSLFSGQCGQSWGVLRSLNVPISERVNDCRR